MLGIIVIKGKWKKDIYQYFYNLDQLELVINHTQQLKKDIVTANLILYLGDNCGEICLDKLLVKKIKEINPKVHMVCRLNEDNEGTIHCYDVVSEGFTSYVYIYFSDKEALELVNKL